MRVYLVTCQTIIIIILYLVTCQTIIIITLYLVTFFC